MNEKNKDNGNNSDPPRKSIYEKRGIGSNPPAKSKSPGPPGSSKKGNQK